MLGQTVGNYRILARLGSGGMGTVYRAKDLRLDREVALKLISGDFAANEAALHRFRDEARAASSLNHPNICTVYDAGEDHGVPYLATELLEGETMAQTIAAGALPVRNTLRLGLQIADALQCAHEKGIVHRDIKPSNIFITARGDAKLLDFGLAKRAAAEGDIAAAATSLTLHGQVLGTGPYMSPEQAEGRAMDARTDIFSFGAVLYEMATGQQAFQGKSLAGVLAEVLHTTPPVATSINPQTPEELARVISKSLEKDPADRYQSAKELAVDLRRCERSLSTPPVNAPTGPVSAAAHARPRKSVLYAAGALLLAAAAAGAVFLSRPAETGQLQSEQITFSTSVKSGPILTDGARLFFSSDGKPSQMSVIGGLIAPMQILAPGMRLLDVSPDGSHMLAILPKPGDEVGRGTLWVSSTLGGAPREVSNVLAQAAVWSADGRSIVFATYHTLSVAAADGAEAKALWQAPGLIDGLAVSPDGQNLSVVAQTGKVDRLWRLHADGKDPHLLLADWPENAIQISGQWTRHGRFLFASDREGHLNEYELLQPAWFEFWKKPSAVRLTGNELETLSAVPSRDGNSLLVLARLNQGELQVLNPATKSFMPYLHGLAASEILISPDRRHMVYTQFPTNILWLSDLDGGNAAQLSVGAGYLPTWAPDSQAVVYSDWHRLWMARLDGSRPQVLVPKDDFEAAPTWSPDGKSIAFTYFDFASQPHGIYILDLASRSIQIMPGAEQFYEPLWSPDGNSMIALAANPSRFVLFSASTKTWTDLHHLADPPGYSAWTSDSKALYSAAISGKHPGMFRLSVPGGQWEQVGSFDGMALDDWDSFVSVTRDDQPAIMNNSGVAQIYSMPWRN
jgi:serine/threonine protein kinase/dipeptidyl aminopeptidase/acylaminoacyl peptidase